jgi:hypothetical protein
MTGKNSTREKEKIKVNPDKTVEIQGKTFRFYCGGCCAQIEYLENPCHNCRYPICWGAYGSWGAYGAQGKWL